MNKAETSNPINFEVRHSAWRLLLFAAASLAFVVPLSYVIAASDDGFGWPVLLVTMAGLLFFGGAFLWFITCLIDRRAITITAEGIVIHEWSQVVIPHKAIKRLRDGGSHLGLWLNNPSRFPPSTLIGKMRHKIEKRFELKMWGDVYAVTLLYDHSNDEIIHLLELYRPKSAFEQYVEKVIAEPDVDSISPE